MSAVPKALLTEEEYLRIERGAVFRSEFFRGEMFAMAGASFEHTRVKDNLSAALQGRFRGGPCWSATTDLRVQVEATGLYTYPDLVAACGPPEFRGAARDTLVNPALIVEVLSDSTEQYDRGKKFGHYQRVDSLREYLLICQDQPRCESFVRQPDGSWRFTVHAGLAAELVLTAVPARIPLAELYEGVAFPPPS